MAQDPDAFYKSARLEGDRVSEKKATQAWKDLDEVDERMDIENEKLARHEHKRFYEKKLPQQKERLEGNQGAGDLIKVPLASVFSRGWPYFRDYWNRRIENFWEKVRILDEAFALNGKKAQFRLLDLKLHETRKAGVRPDIRKPRHFRRVIFMLNKEQAREVRLPPRKVSVVHFKRWVCARDDFQTVSEFAGYGLPATVLALSLTNDL